MGHDVEDKADIRNQARVIFRGMYPGANADDIELFISITQVVGRFMHLEDRYYVSKIVSKATGEVLWPPNGEWI